MRILVVEDDYISRRLLCRYLEPFGACEEAVNGHEAIDAIRRALAADQYYDLICLDIMMPGMDGQQALVIICGRWRRITAVPLGSGAKVIMTSAMEDNQYIMQALNASADGYVVKPIEKRSFIETLKNPGSSWIRRPSPSRCDRRVRDLFPDFSTGMTPCRSWQGAFLVLFSRSTDRSAPNPKRVPDDRPDAAAARPSNVPKSKTATSGSWS